MEDSYTIKEKPIIMKTFGEEYPYVISTEKLNIIYRLGTQDDQLIEEAYQLGIPIEQYLKRYVRP